MDAANAVAWLDLLDVALGYVDQIRQRIASGQPATKEEFDTLHAQFDAERARVGAQVEAMPSDPAASGNLVI